MVWGGYAMSCVCFVAAGLRELPTKRIVHLVSFVVREGASGKKTDDFYQKMEAETDVNQAP